MIFKKTWQNAILVISAIILFTLGYYQAPLFSSNQYQYFLHGFAKAGVGFLAEDWLANTTDPTPVFSFLVTLTEIIHLRGLFYVYFGLLAGVYLFSLASIVNHFFPVKRNMKTFAIFFTGMIVLHSAGLRWLLFQIPGADWSYLFDGGFAGQRLLGQVFQPSVFGVLLLLSISLYLERKILPASLAAVLASTFHPTYLLSSAVLILSYMLDLWFLQKSRLRTIQTGILALVLVCPIAIYSLLHFTGSSPVAAERAREILINFRIPHHAKVQEWFDATTVIKLVLISITLFWVRCKQFRLLILFPLGVSLLLTFVQFITQNSTLALVFPWRISTWLMPIATAILVGRFTVSGLITEKISQKALVISTVILIGLAVASGIIHALDDRIETRKSTSLGLESYVREHRTSGEKYLIPVKMYDFRLKSGVPVYGDFFAIPYTDSDVIEWYSQFLNAKHFYEGGDCSLLTDLHWQGVTNVVIPTDFQTTCPGILKTIFQDDAFILLKLY